LFHGRARSVYPKNAPKNAAVPLEITIVSSFLPVFLHPATHHCRFSEASSALPNPRRKKTEKVRKSGTLNGEKGINMCD
jgi:hypothetical protein